MLDVAERMKTVDDLLAELREHEREYPSLIHSTLCGHAANEIERMRSRLTQIVTVCDDNAQVSRPELALKFVRDVAAQP